MHAQMTSLLLKHAGMFFALGLPFVSGLLICELQPSRLDQLIVVQMSSKSHFTVRSEHETEF